MKMLFRNYYPVNIIVKIYNIKFYVVIGEHLYWRWCLKLIDLYNPDRLIVRLLFGFGSDEVFFELNRDGNAVLIDFEMKSH